MLGVITAQKAEQERVELESKHCQELEAVGQLAAGIAHEINTPTQFVGDSMHFLRSAFDDLQELISKYAELTAVLAGMPEHEHLFQSVKEAEEAADLEYLRANVPEAFERTFDGISRIASIVGAMKEFAHPDQRGKSLADLNRALKTTLTVAKNEYKYVAEVETELGELPPVACHVGDLNQVFLNLIVNAAHAISDVVADSGARGTPTWSGSCFPAMRSWRPHCARFPLPTSS